MNNRKKLFLLIVPILLLLVTYNIGLDSEIKYDDPNASLIFPPNLLDLNGKSMPSWESMKGDIAVLHFWATWCATCVMEMPSLDRFSRDFADSGVSVFAINAQPKGAKGKIENYLKSNGLTLPVYLDPDLEFTDKLGVLTYPESFIVDRNGKLLEWHKSIVFSKSVRCRGDIDWDDKRVRKMFKDLVKESVEKSVSKAGE